MRLEIFLKTAIEPALLLLPSKMTSDESKAMLIAIALQESKLEYRFQIGGPARGYYQFEQGSPKPPYNHTGVYGVLNHRLTGSVLTEICEVLDFPATAEQIYNIIAYNDVLASVVARLLLWTVRDPLPKEGESEKAWLQYSRKSWNPGKPHPETWEDNFIRAWKCVRTQ